MKVVGTPNKCYYCGRDEYCTKDHFFAKSQTNTAEKRVVVSVLYPAYVNILVYACSLCQRVKANLLPHEFLQKLEKDQRYNIEQKQYIKRAVTSLIGKLKINNEISLLDKTIKQSLLLEAIEVIDDYLNAGCKNTRTAAALKGKRVYKNFYGYEYKNRNERL